MKRDTQILLIRQAICVGTLAGLVAFGYGFQAILIHFFG